jgi:cyclic pyranopterin phosphate synthase
MSDPHLSHVGADGLARMVDIGGKDPGERVAVARARVRMSSSTAAAVGRGEGPKGAVLDVARLAGIQAAKQTPQLIPLAHPLALTFVDITASVDVTRGLVELLGEARTVGRTGVEMEAMTACAVAALTVYDMVKGVERDVSVEEIVLLEKRGGRADYARESGGSETSGDRHPALPAGASRTAVITISTSKAQAPELDRSGPELVALAARLGGELVGQEVIPDDRGVIEDRLRHWADHERCSLVLTSGGTGVAPSDVTPEATAAVIDREITGVAEAMRSASSTHTPQWMLSRAIAGVRGSTLIINLPGNPASIEQIAPALLAATPHALELIAGARSPHTDA